MTKRVTCLVLYGGLAILFSGCATKGYVREQVSSAEGRGNQKIGVVDQRIESQDAKLRETSTQLDSRIGEVRSMASQASSTGQEAKSIGQEAKKTADDVSAAVRDVDSRTTQRFAARNQYTVIDTKSLVFDFGKADLRDESVNLLREVAAALKQDPNAVVELQGHTDGVGSDRFNLQLSRERVDTVTRYLVNKEGIDLRRIHTVGLGKEAPVADNGSKNGRAKNRRVEIRVLTTQL
jgi:outer membrane protein OmpA-like peptidoglycan-associated protein